ncbi:MAG: DUF952 domain-containing protein [Xanthomonadales bacterium]|nr:hypothetical protein [Xanthomonadales bacterium]MCC6591735.1 DUF952 domain-containing protein [Xanthomonadales bacterium]MCE7929756.1 DUF952 domain-containing protein [Xanthomonadales bacterium PRO6]
MDVDGLALDPARVYKLLPLASWQRALREGGWAGSADDLRDGYIHLSAADQVAGTLAKYFAAVDDLALVAFDPASLGAALRWEVSRAGARFPHLYAPLPASAGSMIAWRERAGDRWQDAP